MWQRRLHAESTASGRKTPVTCTLNVTSIRSRTVSGFVRNSTSSHSDRAGITLKTLGSAPDL